MTSKRKLRGVELRGVELRRTGGESAADAALRGSGGRSRLSPRAVGIVRELGGRTFEVIGFYNPGRDTKWDAACGSGFLGNFYETPFAFFPPVGQLIEFRNAEAAFQACKCWSRASDFAALSGNAAYRLKKQLRNPDFTYGGFGRGNGANWRAMQAVLAAKFAPGSELACALLATKSSFLLEHNETAGRDSIWSDNFDGTGTNWLGAQLMLLRERLEVDSVAEPGSWTGFIAASLNLLSGSGGRCARCAS
ncbi:hypothetical protein T492DRAFT_1152584 [Pavlovales sp. CCMP2436]|nr:hypothetical protein T492DRAFT_1152584 [Pavlovales sp. CCMP2436]